jgi:hypothetical protein
MKKCFFIFLILPQHLVMFAQFTDDFSDKGFVNTATEHFKKVTVLSA